MKSVTVVLNGFKRQRTLADQISSLRKQSHPVDRIMYFNLKSDDERYVPDYDLLDREGIEYAETSHDYGVWGRFSFALNATTDFICIMDDDIIPGSKFIENCVRSYQRQPGIYGALGSVMSFREGKAWTYGWKETRNADAVQVNYLFQTWFMPREAIHAFWSKMPSESLSQDRHCGEDMNVSLMARKRLGLKSYVVPHPEDDPQMWGNISGEAYGVDQFAIHLDEKMQKAMARYLYQSAIEGLELVGAPVFNTLFFVNRLIPHAFFGKARERWISRLSPFLKHERKQARVGASVAQRP